MSYQQPPDDPYQQQARPPFTPYGQSQASYGAPQAQQRYQQPPESFYGPGDLQPGQEQYQDRYAVDQQSSPSPATRAPHPGHRAQRQIAGKQYGLRGAETFWYVLGCIDFGTAYFAKLPTKKAACEVFSELQLDGQGPSSGYSLQGMEAFWYLLMCLPFGAGYFAKVFAKKALWELVGMVQAAPGGYAEAIGRAWSGTGPGTPY
ncbi:MAG TPA: hypothetical protein VME19_17330 [Streptosporangiaceae bacterium]|nr:hypothetical protein [Streptosporangiaceae bacterium]